MYEPGNKKCFQKKFSGKYTPQNCVYDCYMQSIQKHCGCVLLADIQTDVPFCNISTAVKCATPLSMPPGYSYIVYSTVMYMVLYSSLYGTQ